MMTTSTPKMLRIPSSTSSSSTGSIVIDLIDPRSPTSAFQRTPIHVVVNNNEDKGSSFRDISAAHSSPVSFVSSFNCAYSDKMEEECDTLSTNYSFASAENEDTFSNVDLSSQDVSAIVSDLSISSSVHDKATNAMELISTLGEKIKEVKLENTKSDLNAEISLNSDAIDDSISETKPLIKKPTKKLFFTPNKKRSPLVAVGNICQVTPSALESPKNVIREKQWKRIQEERKKLGFESDENFQFPLYDVTASAPSKLMLRRQNIQNRHNLS